MFKTGIPGINRHNNIQSRYTEYDIEQHAYVLPACAPPASIFVGTRTVT
ncbi:hypothetical protein CCU_18390 [Coprococcus sp. ART55/1]|nr:hypothetical protein CCU_18390 [Coprococcus sp. ART55/1]